MCYSAFNVMACVAFRHPGEATYQCCFWKAAVLRMDAFE